MNKPTIDYNTIKNYLKFLEERTRPECSNRLITTNWDYLLQREILNLQLTKQPEWLCESHVFHLNGTAEPHSAQEMRSPFLLEEDPASLRVETPEANIVYGHMIWDSLFIVIGMSFECDTDRFLLRSLHRVEDDLPIGESSWVVLNPDSNALHKACDRIGDALPRAAVVPVQAHLNDWLQSGTAELKDWGTFNL